MAKWLRFAEAVKNPHYQAVINEAVERLTRVGSFSIDEILESTGLSVFHDSIRFDYVRRAIEEEYNTDLIPLSKAYFKHHAAKLERTFPGRFIATGHGKNIHGFALATAENGHFVLYQLQHKHKRTVGHANAHDRMVEIGQRVGVVAPRPQFALISNSQEFADAPAPRALPSA